MKSLHDYQCAILSALDRNDTDTLNQLLAERDDRYPMEEEG